MPAPPPAPAVDPRASTYAQSLLNAVKAGQTPSAVADAILSMVPDESIDELNDMVNDPGFVGTMLRAEAELTTHQAWLVDLCNEIRSRIVEEPEALPQPQAEPVVAPAQAPAPSPEETA